MAEGTVATPVVPVAPVVDAKPIEKSAPVAAEKIEEIDPSQTPVQKRKIKWGDTEKEVTVDEAIKLAEKAFGIEEKARVASEKYKNAEALLDMIQNNPREFAKRCAAMGIDARKAATDILYEQIELNSLSPEQRELKEYKEKEAAAESLRKETEEAAKKADIDAKTIAWSQKFEKELQVALEAKQLPMSRLTLALAAQYIDAGLAQKKEYTVEQVLPYVIRDLKNIHTSTMGSLEGEALLNYIGDDISNKIAKARVERYKKGSIAQPVVSPNQDKSRISQKEDISKLKGKAYWAALRRQKSDAGIDAFPGA